MKILLFVSALLLLCGCASSARLSVAPGEAHQRFVVRHTQPASEAFNHVELALAESYNDLPAVLKLKQPESGTFLLKPLVNYQVGGALGPSQHARYTLKTVVESNTVAMDFQLEPEITTGYWAPVSEMPKIKASFRTVVEKVAAAVSGTVE
ncbi:MAG TPA: hypothetical protein VK530_01550 [Candidatus Acidoferrum sp.]|nr:hypothetical protein [Candidatus Acidoferrum sp.]